MYSKSTAHMRSNGSHFLTAGLFMYWTCKDKKTIQRSTRLLQDSVVEGYYVFNDDVTIHSKGPVLVSYVFKDNCTYKVKLKPLFDVWVLGVRNI